MKKLKYVFNYDELDFGAYDFNEQIITINPKAISSECVRYDVDFHTLLLHVINHEYLHHILYIEHSYDAGLRLDGITHGAQKNKNIWDYWLA